MTDFTTTESKLYLDNLSKLFDTTVKTKATDLIIKPNSKPIFSFNFGVSKIENGIDDINVRGTVGIVYELLKENSPEQLKYFKGTDQDGKEYKKRMSFSFGINHYGEFNARFRVKATMIFPEGWKLTFRAIPENVPTFEELKIPTIVRSISEMQNGIILVSGPTGSGKTTTCVSVIQSLVETKESNIITLEDPVEYILKDSLGIISQREIGTSTESFKDGLLDAIREKPNVIFLGELGTKESVDEMLKASDAGLLVICTLHAPSSANTISRILSYYENEDTKKYVSNLLCQNLKLIVNQRLVGINSQEGDFKNYVVFETVVLNNQIRESIKKFDIRGVQTSIEDSKLNDEDGKIQLLNEQLIILYLEGKIDVLTLKQNSYDWDKIKMEVLKEEIDEKDRIFIESID